MLAKKKQERAKSTKVNISNTPYLVIVESPSKCDKIEKYLGFQYRCIASKGHIREIKKVASAKDHYTPEYDIIKEKQSHVHWMKTIVSQFSKENIYLGVDDDREGEGIAWHICEVCGLDPLTTKRILFHEVTQTALQEAIKKPLLLRMNIVRAQQARQVLDRMIGFQISPILSRLVVHDNSKFLSAGRCQTPTLRLVYDRYMDSAKKKEKLQYKIQGMFLPKPSTISATLNTMFDKEDMVITFLESSKKFSHILNVIPKKEKTTKAPTPYNTSQLLQNISGALRISPKHVMDCCQKLYQDGYITYMRTESKKYAKGFLEKMREYIAKDYGNEYIGSFSKIENKDNNNPHEAVRVTNIECARITQSDETLNSVYQLVRKRTIESCMSDYKYEDNGIEITAPTNSKYIASIEIPSFLGWKRYNSTIPDMNKLRETSTKQLQMAELYNKKVVSFLKISCMLHMKEMETYYNEAGLIQKLESLGIGRPSTYSMLVDTIQERKYVNKEDIAGEQVTQNEYYMETDGTIETKEVCKTFGNARSKLRIQELGIQSIRLLYEHFSQLFDYKYTSEMENALDNIIKNEDVPWYTVCEKCEETIKKCTIPMNQKMKKSYEIDETHELIFGKSGAMLRVKGEKNYKSLKNNLEIDFNRLENNDYTLDELIDIKDNCLGVYENETMYIKKGPYGEYVEWGTKKESIKGLITKNKPLNTITLEDVTIFLENKTEKKDTTIVRILDNETSVRKGRFGNYVYHKPMKMKKPYFINIKKCPHDVLTEDQGKLILWIKTQIQ